MIHMIYFNVPRSFFIDKFVVIHFIPVFFVCCVLALGEKSNELFPVVYVHESKTHWERKEIIKIIFTYIHTPYSHAKLTN